MAYIRTFLSLAAEFPFSTHDVRFGRRFTCRYRYAGYETTYQYYGMTDDGLYGGGMAPCEIGTDCSDCNVQVRCALRMKRHGSTATVARWRNMDKNSSLFLSFSAPTRAVVRGHFLSVDQQTKELRSVNLLNSFYLVVASLARGRPVVRDVNMSRISFQSLHPKEGGKYRSCMPVVVKRLEVVLSPFFPCTICFFTPVVQYVKEGACSNTCRHARDNVCDDPRFSGECPSGTDCQDCGPWGEANTNFTDPAYYSSRSWLDDDDWEMMINDDQLIDGQSMNVQATYKRNWNDRHVAHKVQFAKLTHVRLGVTTYLDPAWLRLRRLGAAFGALLLTNR